MTLSSIKSTLTGADLIDVQDLIDAYEQAMEDEDAEAVAAYDAVLAQLRGNGGDVQYRGAWYPAQLIRDSCFADYARELVEDCDYLPRDLPHWIEIDWDATARNVRMDYSCIDVDGDTYWYR